MKIVEAMACGERKRPIRGAGKADDDFALGAVPPCNSGPYASSRSELSALGFTRK